MREIKFRAWDSFSRLMITNMYGFVVDPNKKRFRYFRLDELKPDGMGTAVGDLIDFELMQYTGLKDKNGTEIYEGDIAKTTNSIGVIEYEPQGCCYHMKWKDSNGVHRYRMLGATEGSESGYYCSWLSASGNIHENPDLL